MDNLLSNLFKKSKKYLDDRKRLKKLISKASDKSMKLKDKDKRDAFKDDVNSSILLLKDWSNKEYTDIPKKSILSIIAAMIYFIIPTDLIPDFILGTGFLDDAAVLSFLFASIKGDIEKYRIFKINKNQKKSTRENVFLGYESLAILSSRNERYFFETLIYYFSKYEYSQESFSLFLKEKFDILQFHSNDYVSVESQLLESVALFSCFYNKSLEDRAIVINEFYDVFFKDSHNEKYKDSLVIFAGIINKIMQEEKDKTNLFFEHDFKTVSIENEPVFNFASGQYLKSKVSELFKERNDNLQIKLNQICFLLYHSNSYLNLLAMLKENERIISNSVKNLSVFLGAIVFEQPIVSKKTYISNILNLHI